MSMQVKSHSTRFPGLCLIVLPSDAEKFPFYKSIESKVSLPIAYRTRQCDTITVPQATLFAWRLGVKMHQRNRGGSLLDFRRKRCDDYRVSMALEELEHETPQDRASDR